MALETEDLINVEIDLSSQLEKLNLENIPNDFLEKISKFDEQSDIENVFLLIEEDSMKYSGEVSCKEFKSPKIKTSLSDDKLCTNEHKEKAFVDMPDIRKDINGNHSFEDENLANLIIKCENLKFSDSDNEDTEESQKLKEKGPSRRTVRHRQVTQNLARRDIYDRSQFNPEILRHLSGSHTQWHETVPVVNQLLHEVDHSNALIRNQTSSFGNNSTCNFATSQNACVFPASQNNSVVIQNETSISASYSSDLFYDYAPNSLSSPESGYASITGSPPYNVRSPASYLDLKAENIDEEEVFEIYLDFESKNLAHSVPTAQNLIPSDVEGENKNCTERILNFLIGNPTVQCELPTEVSGDYAHTVQNQSPLIAFHPEQTSNYIEIELKDLPTSAVSSEVNCEHIPTELNDLLFTSKTSYDQVLEDLNKLPTVTSEASFEHALREPNDFLATVSYEASSVIETQNLAHMESSEVSSSDYVPFINSSAASDSSSVVAGARSVACRPLKGKAKTCLRQLLSDEKVHAAEGAIYRKINEDKRNNRKIKVIYIEDEAERQTNLHKAVLSENIEEVYCLVGINKQYTPPEFDQFGPLNIRDSHNKTALDYVMSKDYVKTENCVVALLVDFLKENNACLHTKV